MSKEEYYGFRKEGFIEKLKSRFLEVVDNADRIEEMKIEAQVSRGEAPLIRYEITELLIPEQDGESEDAE